jgi:nitroimidazol reductase NimA-like FMN-containing flavoprotein (pyridoxamine 5'-phosphate oxidase superfamily)/GNAT superfamily N-acetyltransferase
MDSPPPIPLPPVSTALPETERTTLTRRAARGSHERAAIDAILDEALVCHVGVNVDGSPRVLPTAHVRVGDVVYLHGARQNRLLRALAEGAPCCLTVTLIDGLVFSRIAFSHSINYRSVVLYGVACEVIEAAEKRIALHALVEHIAAGRAGEARPPTDEQLQATLVVRVPITEGSAKTRSGPPLDKAEVLGDDCWAGELPLRLCALPPRPDPQLAPGRALGGAVLERARSLGLGARATHERAIGELLISTDPARLDVALVHRFLSQESYWAHGVSEATVRRTIEHALCFGLYRGGEQLGFARVVTDFARFAYLGDVFIVAAERGRGLGKLLIEHVLGHPDLAEIERWTLGTLDAHDLYARYGFQKADASRFMVRQASRP